MRPRLSLRLSFFSPERRLLYPSLALYVSVLYPLLLSFRLYVERETKTLGETQTHTHAPRRASRRPSVPAGVSNRTAGVARRWRRRRTPPPPPPSAATTTAIAAAAVACVIKPPPPPSIGRRHFFFTPEPRVTNPPKTFRLEVRAFRSRVRESTEPGA